MQGNDMTTHRTSWQRWATPTVAVLMAVTYLIAGLLGGDRTFALVGLAIMLVVAAGLLVLGRFSETVAGLLDRRDERINSIDAQATVVAGMSVITAVIVGFVVEISRGQDGEPYSMLGAIGGVAYVGALVVLRLRR